jgi:hypothetical protein
VSSKILSIELCEMSSIPTGRRFFLVHVFTPPFCGAYERLFAFAFAFCVTGLCVCVCVCVLRHRVLAVIVEVLDLPSLKCSSHWSLELFPASEAPTNVVVRCICALSLDTRNRW